MRIKTSEKASFFKIHQISVVGILTVKSLCGIINHVWLYIGGMLMKTIFFDLDGTLLPMDQEEFTGSYFGHLAKTMAPFGYESEKLIKSVWAGTADMIMNDGSASNEEVFWKKFSEIWGDKGLSDKKLFDEFYEKYFCDVKKVCGFNAYVPEMIKKLKALGYRVVIATNPIFPMEAQKQRIEWAGLSADDFDYITSYENSHYSKPNPKYYTEIIEKLGLDASECIMAGNDVNEDVIAAEAAGLDVFLITDCMINKKGTDISSYKKGGFHEFMEFTENK